MFKNLLLIILIIINSILVSLFQQDSIDMLSLHIIAASFTTIISLLYLITRVSKSTMYIALISLIVAAYHIYLIVMTIYNNVYAN
ncbi:hypothetical protein [Macrococcoides caseolyticum]|uniref:hypothetical protein n=1 Tax=Macrococcoides caseolyticum TaxID=69966 RepID=UPI0005A116DF|nr:hypothetical protein [Macrococcus caseolyticus]PKE17537.1 hypothetical protein CW718_03940 [Macrococcus caseolyticus]PKE33563.1 hypothetical protein CW668_06220 [Macrococcus caseolyticus]PKE35671.1 hypothetical protein CW695_06910 [Macrococcus caseolyticus]PKE67650.1 hypothetical protein CW663_06680 [Macrococcus caseolyticus]PKE74494.1 hypothetical protein CW670_06890 [Macrococcus caseolyticus]